MRRRRRGSATLEVALSLPFLLGLFSAVADFGWYFQQRQVLSSAIRDGARVGVSAPKATDPLALAEWSARQALVDAGYRSMDTVGMTADLVEVDGAWSIRLTVRQAYQPVAGLVPCPAWLEVTRVMMLERQDLTYYDAS